MLLLLRKARRAALVGLCLVAGACTHGNENASLEQSIASPAAPRSQMLALAPGRARDAGPLATLPEAAGGVQTVRTHDYTNGLRQDILLKGGSVHGIRNSITLLARTDGRQTLDEQVPLFKPTEAAIRSELGAQFPHLAMQVAERESHNAYGPYGLALGRTDGDGRCLYMWQWIDANRLPRDAGVMGPVSVRVRLCQTGTTFDALASLVDHLVIGAAGATGEAMRGDDQLHVIAAPEAVASADEATLAPPHRRVAKRHAASGRSRIRIAEHRTAAAPDMAGSETPSQPRFMASQPTAPAQQSAARQQSADVVPAKLSTDLPPEAYLGPKASNPY